KDAALACVETLLRLAPQSLAGHDRQACLHYRRGDLNRAVDLLNSWQRLAPTDPWPLIRQAIIEQERGNAEARSAAIDRALGLTQKHTRAAVAYLGARLALRGNEGELAIPSAEVPANGKADPSPLPHSPTLSLPYSHALMLLQECLKDDPGHVEALW